MKRTAPITRPSYGAANCLRRYPLPVPTYQYRCDRCGEQFDLWQSFSDDTLTACPSSGGPSACEAPGEGPVRKVFSPVGITFKGDGFYKNDFGSNSSGMKKEKTAAASGSSSDSKSDAKSDSSKSAKATESGKSNSATSSAKAAAD